MEHVDFREFNFMFRCPIPQELASLSDLFEIVKVDNKDYYVAKLNYLFIRESNVKFPSMEKWVVRPVIAFNVDLMTKEFDIIPFDLDLTTEEYVAYTIEHMIGATIDLSEDVAERFAEKLVDTLMMMSAQITPKKIILPKKRAKTKT